MDVIWLNCGAEPLSPVIPTHPRVRVVDQFRLTAGDLGAVSGLVSGTLLDQDAMLVLRPALEAFLDRGGRWFFNGHFLRPMIAGIKPFRPIRQPRRADLSQTRLAPHPIFAGIEIAQLETNKGVAGFYGRGCNPLPEGAIPVTGLGEALVPVDWVWARPGGGRVFSHAGNDLDQLGREWNLGPLLQGRIIDWAGGGPCLCA
ncbi:MAG TPA: hypothetical protein VNQ78_16540 [Paracoccus sp. (in: a-proteobacteria)]|uniref:hypothetical protein n=1 Tax=Paracoccus sp. TaxID=267 RepID=UPI002BD1279D|nr:hypothetical protein [Paracoccus sp. (in: a-proteobacteria)]HWL58267.1 hypothetical protein [Paracoccus sp. (in: a-proteobacteria)]